MTAGFEPSPSDPKAHAYSTAPHPCLLFLEDEEGLAQNLENKASKP